MKLNRSRLILLFFYPFMMIESIVREIGRTWHNLAFMHRVKNTHRRWLRYWEIN